MDILTVGVVTKPFKFEAKARMVNALSDVYKRQMESVPAFTCSNNSCISMSLLHIYYATCLF